MDKIRIMHIADSHLGLNINFLGKLSENRSLEILNSMAKICQLANEEKVDILLIAGDFIEQSDISDSYMGAVKKMLTDVRARVFIVAGNHDYISIGSKYLGDFSENVHIFKENHLEKIYLEDLNCNIFGASFRGTYQRESLLYSLGELDKDKINIGLLHGDISSGPSLYNPICLDNIEASGLDYLALGHIHKPSGIKLIGKTYYAYPGSPWGQGFDELGSRYGIIGDIAKENVKLREFEIVGPMFLDVHFSVDKYRDEVSLRQALREQLEKEYSNSGENYYRIFLEGYVDAENYIDIALLKQSFFDYKYLEFYDNIRTKYDYEVLRREQSLRGVFVDNILKEKALAIAAGNLDRSDSLDRSMELGLRALEGRKI